MDEMGKFLEQSKIYETMDELNLIAQTAARFKWMEWMERLPFLQFPADWEVKIIPPFAGAIIRFRARRAGSDRSVSVYFDSENRLGYAGGPYWEIYDGDDTSRYPLGEEKSMLADIGKILQG